MEVDKSVFKRSGQSRLCRKMKLRPVSLLHIIQISEFPVDWMVSQTFERDGEKLVISGFGRTREAAMGDFDAEVEAESVDTR